GVCAVATVLPLEGFQRQRILQQPACSGNPLRSPVILVAYLHDGYCSTVELTTRASKPDAGFRRAGGVNPPLANAMGLDDTVGVWDADLKARLLQTHNAGGNHDSQPHRRTRRRPGSRPGFRPDSPCSI